MAVWNMSGIWILVVWMACFMGQAMGNDRVISGKIDIVFLAPASADQRDMASVKEVWRNHLLDHVEMGKETRISVVVFRPNGIPDVLAGLTNDRTAVLDGLNRWAMDTKIEYQHHNAALAMMRDNLFDFNQSDRAKVAVIFLRYHVDPRVQREAKKLREKGAFLYYIYAGIGGRSAHLASIASKCAGSESRVFESSRDDMFSIKSFDIIPRIKAVMERDLCSFCAYKDAQQSTCKPEARQPGMKPDFFGDDNAKCSQRQPGDIKCSKIDCEMECNRQWPRMEKANCTVSCGRRTKRDGSPPPKMEHCRKEIESRGEFANQVSEVEESSPATSMPITSTTSGGLAVGLTIGCLAIGSVILVILVVFIVVIVVVNKRRANAAKAEMEQEAMKKKKASESTYIELDTDDLGDDAVSAGKMSKKDPDGLKMANLSKGGEKIPALKAEEKVPATKAGGKQLPEPKTGGKTSLVLKGDEKAEPKSKSGRKTSLALPKSKSGTAPSSKSGKKSVSLQVVSKSGKKK